MCSAQAQLGASLIPNQQQEGRCQEGAVDTRAESYSLMMEQVAVAF